MTFASGRHLEAEAELVGASSRIFVRIHFDELLAMVITLAAPILVPIIPIRLLAMGARPPWPWTWSPAVDVDIYVVAPPVTVVLEDMPPGFVCIEPSLVPAWRCIAQKLTVQLSTGIPLITPYRILIIPYRILIIPYRTRRGDLQPCGKPPV